MNSSEPGPNPYYPELLRRAEDELVTLRRRPVDIDPSAPRVGLAFSGGGIRSATFNLGVLQALARAQLLRRLDFLSTVSGGGYVGSFFGAWVSRDAKGIDAVERELRSPGGGKPVWFLRENGRDLAPNGSGDMWAAGSAVLRSWVAVLGVLGLFVFAFFLFAVWLREVTGSVLSATPLVIRGVTLWLSPLLTVALVIAIVAILPLIVAFWSLGARPWRLSWIFWGLTALGLGTWIWSGFCPLCANCPPLSPWWTLFWIFAAAVGVLSWAGANLHSERAAPDDAPPAADGSGKPPGDIEAGRRLLTDWLAGALVVTVALVVVGLADTVADSWLLLASTKKIAAVHVALVAAIAAGKFLWSLAGDFFEKQKRPPLSLALIAGIAAGVIALALYTLLDLWALRLALKLDARFFGGESTDAVWCLAAAAGGAFVVCWLVGRGMTFLNLSAHQHLYAARLTRAYLGATNPIRQKSADQDITDPMPGDQIPWRDYRPHAHGGPLHLINATVNETVSAKSQIEQCDRKGFGLTIGPAAISAARVNHALLFAPLTDPTTVAQATEPPRPEDVTHWSNWGHTQLKVFPLALQPGAFPLFAVKQPTAAPVDVLERAEAKFWEAGGKTVAPLAAMRTAKLNEQPPASDRVALDPRAVGVLPVGGWVGVSGAAFSTGLGSRTSLGISFLAGLFNARLGYWWDSGVNPHERIGVRTPPGLGGRVAAAFAASFPVQMHLGDEWLARFHGPARRRWYLTDGGHFENTAAYELLRRRVPVIIVGDCGGDPDYTFDDVGNLVRLARTDFNTEIRFCDAGRLGELVGPDLLKTVGTLAELKLPDAEDAPRFNGKHAALAEVFYEGAKAPGSLLLLLKPTVTGDEPADVLNYYSAHDSFPQESTADQFFDEAQWESYRKLGELIAGALFAEDGGGKELVALQQNLAAGKASTKPQKL